MRESLYFRDSADVTHNLSIFLPREALLLHDVQRLTTRIQRRLQEMPPFTGARLIDLF